MFHEVPFCGDVLWTFLNFFDGEMWQNCYKAEDKSSLIATPFSNWGIVFTRNRDSDTRLFNVR